ncbi:hypothetical protein X736_11060 [Mesorhizobium sp. L2C089B000]|nr:hypothetical protein X736_11060 [Mesorhizobium sp. L2C089B000]
MDSAAKKKVVPAQPGFWRDPRYSGLGALIGVLIFGAITYAIVTTFIPTKGGFSEKCWNYGGRSDDTDC